MRKIVFNKANDNELYFKTTLAKQLGVSVPTVRKYVIDNELEEKAKVLGDKKVYLGSDINSKLNELSDENDSIILNEE